MSPRRAFLVECLMVLFMAVLLMGCTPQTPVEEAAVATHVVAPRPELTPATLPVLTSTPLSTPTATILPVLTETPPLMTPTPSLTPTLPATPTIPPAPTNPPPATPLPPVPVFVGLLRHDLQLHLGDEPSTLSYLTGVGSESHLDALRDVIAANWGSTRVLEEHPVMRFSPDRQLMAFRLDHPPYEDGAGRGAPIPDVVVVNENGTLIGKGFTGVLVDWLPNGEGIITVAYEVPSLYFFDERPWFSFGDIVGLGALKISPDGNTIAYTARPGGGVTDIWRMDQDGNNSALILSLPNSQIDGLTWSPDGNWLACLVNGNLWIVDPTTGNAKPIGLNGIPVWSPDSQRLALYSQHDIRFNETAIYLVDPVSEQVEQLLITFPEGLLLDEHLNVLSALTWSPDGNWLAFRLRQLPFMAEEIADLWVVDLAGTTLSRLTFDGVPKDALRWSP